MPFPEIVMHTEVNLRLSYQATLDLIQGQQVHLGVVPANVEPGHNIFVTCPDIQRTYVVLIDRVHDADNGRNAYASRHADHYQYREPAA